MKATVSIVVMLFVAQLKERRDIEVNLQQKKIRAALDRIDNCLTTINTDKEWLSYLAFQAKFYHYSYSNTILIYSQNCEASYVCGYRAWNKLGRQVRKGASGIMILAPCFRKSEVFKEPDNKSEYRETEGEKEMRKIISGFRPVYVFDIQDTVGDDSQIPILVKGLSGNSSQEKEIYDKLLAIVCAENEVVEVERTAAKGSFNIETGVISIRSDLQYLHKIHTLIHEFAHAQDFKLNPNKNICRNQRELVAESVTYIVCEKLKLDVSDYSMGYLKSWLKDVNELKVVADTVQKIAYTIISKLAVSSDTASLFEEGDVDEQ